MFKNFTTFNLALLGFVKYRHFYFSFAVLVVWSKEIYSKSLLTKRKELSYEHFLNVKYFCFWTLAIVWSIKSMKFLSTNYLIATSSQSDCFLFEFTLCGFFVVFLSLNINKL